jgi:hypothetical protein
MAKPTTEGNSLLDPKGSRKPLKAIPFRAIADHGKAGQIATQKGSSPAQGKITSLPGNQAANKNQLKFGAGLRATRVCDTPGTIDAWLRDKKQLVAIHGKLGIRLRRRCYDRCRVAVGGAGKRQKPVEVP